MAKDTTRVAANGELVLVVQTEDPPTEPEWDEFLTVTKGVRDQYRMVRVLVLSEGGGPNSAQRQKVVKSGWENSRFPVAVVTGSAILRTAMMAFRWFGINIRPFAPDRVAEAVQFLEITPAQLTWAREEVRKMRELLGIKVPIAAL